MTAATDSRTPGQLADAIVSFALEGHFPDEEVSSLALATADLSPPIETLARARSRLESEIHTINEETKGDVSSWISNAKTLQEDILRSKRLADDIVRQSEAPDVSGRAIRDAEDHAEFLQREVAYSQQLHGALQGIRYVDELLGEVEQATNERRILDALKWLEKSRVELGNIPVNKKSCRVMRLFESRTLKLESAVHDVFDHIWNALVHVDRDAGRVSIFNERDDEQMTLSEAIIGLEAYKEVEDRMAKLWQLVDSTVISPRMDANASQRPGIQAGENVLETHGTAGAAIDDLFVDLEKVVRFFAQRLPPDLLIFLSPIMMSDVVPRLVNVWLNAAVPSNLHDIGQLQAAIQSAKRFCDVLEESGFSGFTELKEWVGNAPSIWLAKCRETALDAVRSRLARGLGRTKQVEKVERQMVSRSEGKELAANGVAKQANDDDWGAAWGDDDDQPPEKSEAREAIVAKTTRSAAQADDDGADAWGWGDDEHTADATEQGRVAEDKNAGEAAPVNRECDDDDDEDDAAAWGWGDEDVAGPATAAQPSINARKKLEPSAMPSEESREMVLKETYHISSMPEPVLELISAILEDGAALTQSSHETSPVAAAAPGLLNLPTLALAMFRAVSPHYYASEMGGSMLLYNDAMYMAEKLTEMTEAWSVRDDLTPRARNMLRTENEIKGLQSFANRAYATELSMQKTVVRDLLGGEQSLMQQETMEASVDAAAAQVRSVAETWESILARSVWYQAVGSLVDALSTKIILDVMDMASIGQDEAYNIAQLIAKATEVDSLFLPSRSAAGVGAASKAAAGSESTAETDEIPATAQYAASWLRLKYLSEVLQSNLNEVKYLWCDSELSLYFTAEEVVDLIEASFEANARTKETIRQIRDKPAPLGT